MPALRASAPGLVRATMGRCMPPAVRFVYCAAIPASEADSRLRSCPSSVAADTNSAKAGRQQSDLKTIYTSLEFAGEDEVWYRVSSGYR